MVRSAPLLTNASPKGSAFSDGNETTPGQVIDFPVMVQNNGTQPAVLLSATLIPGARLSDPEARSLGCT